MFFQIPTQTRPNTLQSYARTEIFTPNYENFPPIRLCQNLALPEHQEYRPIVKGVANKIVKIFIIMRQLQNHTLTEGPLNK